MKKFLISSLALLLSLVSFAQVGIGTTTPDSSSILDLTSTNKGLLLPRVANTATVTGAVNGLLIYDLSAQCLKVYQNETWSDCLSTSSPAISAACTGFMGSYCTSALSGTTYVATITNNDFASKTVTPQTTDLSLSGITGLSVSAVSPSVATTIAAGATQTITYTISGTPGTTGTLTGTFNKQGLSCSSTVAVVASRAVTAASATPTLCANTALTPITHTTTGATGIDTATGLPPGVTAAWASNTITISGTPTVAGTYTYNIPVNGCGAAVNATGTITVTTATVVVDCNANGLQGTYTNGIAMTASNKFSVTLSNSACTAAPLAFQTSDLVLSGVSGITVASVSLASVTLSAGQSQLVEYTLSGTPTSSGTLTATWTKLALNCVKTVAVTNYAIASLNCAGATNSGTLTKSTAASNVASVIAYTGGDGSAYSGQTVASTGVPGLTATLAAGNFASGAGNLTYTITGTPAAGGTASFAIAIGGQSCTLTRTVATPVTIPATITLGQNKSHLVVSVYDQDYLPYAAPTGAATTTAQAADGINEAVAINVQGTITTAGVTIQIPITATGSGTLPAYSTTITIPANMTQDGISRDLTLSWATKIYSITTTSITATIKAVGGSLNAKKLDFNTGIGNDALGLLMGQFTLPYNNSGNTTTYSVRAIAALPDKMFNLPDNNGNSTTHLMLYLPIVAEDGKIWLNNNLGAHYATMNHASFNPAQQATSATDYLAYGSLFQWGRKPDGHELITHTNETTGTPVNGTSNTTANADVPPEASFITTTMEPFDWRFLFPNNISWASEASVNNPCPSGFRVPTEAELVTLFAAANITDSTNAANSLLKFTAAGMRDCNEGQLSSLGETGAYWGSSTNNDTKTRYIFLNDMLSIDDGSRANGLTVRCIKD